MKFNWKLLFFPVILLAVLTGCSGGVSNFTYHTRAPVSHYYDYQIKTIYLDKSFNKKELATIIQVINEWNTVLNGYMRIEVSNLTFDNDSQEQLDNLADIINQTHEGLVIFGVNDDHPLFEKHLKDDEGDPDGKLAFVNNLGRSAHLMVVIRNRIGSKSLHKILLHEFGHALGAEHTQAFNLMFPAYGNDQPDCVDKITALQIAHYNGFDINKMNYCRVPDLE